MANLPALLIALPVAGACVLLAFGRLLPRPAVDGVATATALLGLADGIWLLTATNQGRVVEWAGGWQPKPGLTVGIVLVADQLNAALVVLISALAAAALLFGWRYFDDVHAHYPALLLLFVAGMTGFALTGDLFDMFVFFELMGAAAYALTGFKIEEPESVQGGLNFGVVNSLGAYLCLTGIGLLYARTGQLGLAQLGAALSGQHTDALTLAAFVLISTGWLVKAAVVPFHFWLADAHAVAPSPVCVLFSGVMAPLGLYGVARVYWVVFAPVLPAASAHRALLALGTVTALLGAVMCLTQRHVKRLLAYSTIAHLGLFLVALAALTAQGVAGAWLYLGGHALVKGALFLLAGVLLSRYRTIDEHELFGRGAGRRLEGGLFVLGALALAGLPPFGTALGKGLVEETGGLALPLTVLVSALTGGAALRIGLRVYFGLGRHPSQVSDSDLTSGEREEPDVRQLPSRIPATMLIAIGALLAGGLMIGVVPAISRMVAEGAAAFVTPHGYLGAALAGARSVTTTAPEAFWQPPSILFGLLSTTLAAVVAVLALPGRRPRLPLVRRALTGLHRLHSGHLGDYVAWLLFGTAALTALLG